MKNIEIIIKNNLNLLVTKNIETKILKKFKLVIKNIETKILIVK